MNATMSNVSKLIRGSAFQHHGELPRPRALKSRRSNVLYRRIQAAAKEVCGYPGQISSSRASGRAAITTRSRTPSAR